MEKWYSVIKKGEQPDVMENWMRLLLTEKKAEQMRRGGYVVIAI